MCKEQSTRSVIGGSQSQSTQCVKHSHTRTHTRLEMCSFQDGSRSSAGPLLCGTSREIKGRGRQVCRTHQQAPGYTRGLKKQQGAVLAQQQVCLRRDREATGYMDVMLPRTGVPAAEAYQCTETFLGAWCPAMRWLRQWARHPRESAAGQPGSWPCLTQCGIPSPPSWRKQAHLDHREVQHVPLVPLLELHGLLVLAELDHCLPLVPVEDYLRNYATRTPEQA